MLTECGAAEERRGTSEWNDGECARDGERSVCVECEQRTEQSIEKAWTRAIHAVGWESETRHIPCSYRLGGARLHRVWNSMDVHGGAHGVGCWGVGTAGQGGQGGTAAEKKKKKNMKRGDDAETTGPGLIASVWRFVSAAGQHTAE